MEVRKKFWLRFKRFSQQSDSCVYVAHFYLKHCRKRS